MANSPAHKFGQIIGNLAESIFEPRLQAFCEEAGLYLDRKGARSPVREGKKLSWIDHYQNSHDLDFVIELGGRADILGRPLAFIEVAWRSYTKHSKNKAQEIQGALLPILEEYRLDQPFVIVILVGKFTTPSITQLRSQHFDVIHITYDSIVAAFDLIGIDVEFGEKMPREWFEKKIIEFDGKPNLRSEISNHLSRLYADEIDLFFEKLRVRLARTVKKVLVAPLYGKENGFESITEAVAFIEGNSAKDGTGPLRGFDVVVRYSNGDHIDGRFADVEQAVKFLRYFAV